MRAGAAASDVDAIARTEIEESGLAPVLHGLGHGVGLEVHEQPVLRPTSEDTLVAGNVVTVEPGVYLAGVIAAGNDANKIFIENGREHGALIVADRLPATRRREARTELVR